MAELISGITWESGNVVTATKLMQMISLGKMSPRNFLDGFTLSPSEAEPLRDIVIQPGFCRSHDNAAEMEVTSATTKRTDQAWAVGSGAGGMDTGTRPTNGTLHVWAISGGAAPDYLFSVSATAPTMPGGYTIKRRIGAFLTDGSGEIRPFRQNGGEFHLMSPIRDLSYTQGTTATLQSILVPSGISVLSVLNVAAFKAGTTAYALISDPALDITATPLSNNIPFANIGASAEGVTQIQSTAQVFVRTNASSQIRINAADASTSINLSCVGWIDTRGRDT